jgi:hypothetical protein
MPRLFRLVAPHGELVADGDSIECLKGILGELPPGRYHVDEMSTTPLSLGHTARRWGILLKLEDGTKDGQASRLEPSANSGLLTLASPAPAGPARRAATDTGRLAGT